MADVKDLAQRFGPLVVDLRGRRKPIEETWLMFHQTWRGKTTRAFYKSEIFKHFLPAARRAVEKFVKRGAQMLVPSSEFFEVYPAAESSEIDLDERAGGVQAYLSYLWTKRIKVYPFVRKLLRTYCLYGRCIAKTGVEIVELERLGPKNKALSNKFVWPTVRVVDPFMFYVFPESESDVEKSMILVEDHMMPYDTYKRHSDNPATGVKPIKQEDLGTPVWPDHQIRRLQHQNLPEPTAISVGKDDKGERPVLVEFVALSEVWYRDGGRWKMCWLAWNVKGGDHMEPTLVRDNPREYPRHPYRMAVDREVAGEHYTTGMMDDLEPLNVLLNDQLNMTLEGQATQFSPPAVINPDLVSRPSSIVFRPRAKWFANPEGIKWLEPTDTTDAGFRGIQLFSGWMDQYSGGGGVAEGQPARNMPRAGFAVSSLMSLSLSDTRDAAQMIEDQVLTPLLGDLYRLTLEYVPEKQLIRIPGAEGMTPRQVSVEDLWGDFEFRWIGSIQSQDYQVRAQRMVATLGMIARLAPAIQPQLQSEGKMMDWEYLFRRVWREALGERGAGAFIRKMTPQELQFTQQMLMMQAQAAQTPVTKINLRGDLDPVTSKELSREQTPVELETLHQAGEKGTKTAGGANPQSPATAEGGERQASRQMSRVLSE